MEVTTFLLQQALNYSPYIAVYGGILVLVVWGTIKLTKFWSKTTTLHTDVPEIKSTLNKIHTGLTTLNQVLLEGTIIKQSCYSSGNSPRTVNELGKRVLAQSGANDLITTHADAWIRQLEERHPATLLDLEREAFRLILSRMNDADFVHVKNFAFEHPNFENTPLSYTDILFPMSLELRDLYRSRHPELKGDE